MIPEAALQELIGHKNPKQAMERCQEHGYSEGWALRDGALVVYDCDDPPTWLPADNDA